MAPRGRMQASTWETIFGVAYLLIGTNAMLVVGCLPVLVLLASTDPRSSWPALALAAVLAAPALTGAFAVFRGYSERRSTEVLRTFWSAWLRHLRYSLAVGVIVVGSVVVLLVDMVVFLGLRLGAVVLPLLGMLTLLVLATGLLALVGTVERPDARLRDVLKASLYFSVRRWYLTLVSFAALGLLGALFVEHPALATGIAATPLLYAAWGNSRYALKPVLPHGATMQRG